MSRKMYKKGIEDLASVWKTYGEQELEALNKILDDIKKENKVQESELKKLKMSCYDILSYIESKEKAALYQLSPTINIQDFDDEDKTLIASVIYRLAEENSNLHNDNQRRFLASLLNHLGVTTPQICPDYLVIQKIDSINVQKAIMQVAFEYLYLQNGDEITNEQETFFDNFSLNQTQIELVECEVIRQFRLLGSDGLAAKYGAIKETVEELNCEAFIDKIDGEVTDLLSAPIDIPLEIADEIYSSGLINNLYETKNYFIYCDNVNSQNKNENNWTRVTKKDKTCYKLKSFPIVYDIHWHNPFCCLKTIDYENDTIYYFKDGILHKNNLSEDTDFIYENFEYEPNDSVMCYCNNSIVIIDWIKAFHIDLINGVVSYIKDASGKTFPSQSTNTVVPISDEVLFYIGEDGAKLTGSDGNGLKESLCSINVNDKNIKCILKLSEFESKPWNISRLFVKNNELYAVCSHEDKKYSFYKINLTERKAYIYKLHGKEQFNNYNLNNDYFVCVYQKDEKTFPICEFDFKNDEFVEITSEGYRINRNNLGKEEYLYPSISLIGQWLYYSQRTDKPKYTVIEKNEYRINLNSKTKNPTLINEREKAKPSIKKELPTNFSEQARKCINKYSQQVTKIALVPGACIPFIHGKCVDMIKDLNSIAGINNQKAFAEEIMSNALVGAVVTPLMAVPLLSSLAASSYIETIGESYQVALENVFVKATSSELNDKTLLIRLVKNELKSKE